MKTFINNVHVERLMVDGIFTQLISLALFCCTCGEKCQQLIFHVYLINQTSIFKVNFMIFASLEETKDIPAGGSNTSFKTE